MHSTIQRAILSCSFAGAAVPALAEGVANMLKSIFTPTNAHIHLQCHTNAASKPPAASKGNARSASAGEGITEVKRKRIRTRRVLAFDESVWTCLPMVVVSIRIKEAEHSLDHQCKRNPSYFFPSLIISSVTFLEHFLIRKKYVTWCCQCVLVT